MYKKPLWRKGACIYLFVIAALIVSAGTAVADGDGGEEQDSQFWNGSSWGSETSSSSKPEARKADITVSSPPAPSQDILESLFEQSRAELQEVEQLLRAQQFGQALTKSKAILDRIKQRTGVHPKAKFREKIHISGVITNNDLKKTYAELNNNQKDLVALAVASHKGGFYLDLLNQAKRASLLYLKAFYHRIKSMGHLRSRDINKVKSDLLAIHNIQILIQDANSVDSLIIFDKDVADSDQNYFFNRELVDFALSATDLGFTEESIEEALMEDSNQKQQAHWNGLVQIKPAFDSKACIANYYGKYRYQHVISYQQAKTMCEMSQKKRDCMYDHYGLYRFQSVISWSQSLEICSNK